MNKIIGQNAIKRRLYWINEICNLSGNFGDDSERLEFELVEEIKKTGTTALIDHLRLCGNIPESYRHDSSEEKLYSKYTDILLSISFKTLGLESLVIKGRSDDADVEVFAKNYSFVADAKSFRLSRTAKNQKDFKIQAMDNWKRGKQYAMVVCPIYQLPNKTSQIYLQATTRNVCVFTYSHLSLLMNFSEITSKNQAQGLLKDIFKTIPFLNPSKSAIDFWLTINRLMLKYSSKIEKLWSIEKKAAFESINIAKEEGLTFLAIEREKIMRMSHRQALNELIKVHKIESKIQKINSISDNGLFSVK